MKNLDVHFSSKSDDWATPQDFFNKVNAEFGPFDLDVCASHDNFKCPKYLTSKGFFDSAWGWISSADGLNGEWAAISKRAWCNPPYGRQIGKWIKKAYEESQKGCLVVALLPARTDTRYFHTYIYGQVNVEIRFIRGRLRFGRATASAPFPLMLVIFHPKKD